MLFGDLLSALHPPQFLASFPSLGQQRRKGTNLADRTTGCSGLIALATLFVVLLSFLQVFLVDCREQGVDSSELFS